MVALKVRTDGSKSPGIIIPGGQFTHLLFLFYSGRFLAAAQTMEADLCKCQPSGIRMRYSAWRIPPIRESSSAEAEFEISRTSFPFRIIRSGWKADDASGDTAGCAASKRTVSQRSRLPGTRRSLTSRCSYIHSGSWPSALHGPDV